MNQISKGNPTDSVETDIFSSIVASVVDVVVSFVVVEELGYASVDLYTY
jgi:hypothetical protein